MLKKGGSECPRQVEREITSHPNGEKDSRGSEISTPHDDND